MWAARGVRSPPQCSWGRRGARGGRTGMPGIRPAAQGLAEPKRSGAFKPLASGLATSPAHPREARGQAPAPAAAGSIVCMARMLGMC
jgi:hypothetical protein